MGAKIILLFLILELCLFVKLVVMQKQEVVGGDTSDSARNARMFLSDCARCFTAATKGVLREPDWIIFQSASGLGGRSTRFRVEAVLHKMFGVSAEPRIVVPRIFPLSKRRRPQRNGGGSGVDPAASLVSLSFYPSRFSQDTHWNISLCAHR